MENKNLLSKEILIMLLLQIPFNIFFYLLYKPYVIHPYTNMVYFIFMLLIGYFFASWHGNVSYLYNNSKKSKITIVWTTVAMFVLYFILRFREMFLSSFEFFKKIEQAEKGQWRYFSQPWLDINLVVSFAGIVLVVVGMEYFYRAYVQELLGKYFTKNQAVIYMSIVSGLHSAVLGTGAGMVDFTLALIWGWVYIESGLLASIFVHLVWDILFIYFPGN